MLEQLKIYEEKVNKSLNALWSECIFIRAERADPYVLNEIKVDYYGASTPLQQVDNVTVPGARMIQIQPQEKSLLGEVEKAIQMSDLGINPTSDSNVTHLISSELTEKRRRELAKNVKKKGEAARVAMRNVRRDTNDTIKKLEKSNEIPEDEWDDAEEQIQKLTDKMVKKVDGVVRDKTKKIMTI